MSEDEALHGTHRDRKRTGGSGNGTEVSSLESFSGKRRILCLFPGCWIGSMSWLRVTLRREHVNI